MKKYERDKNWKRETGEYKYRFECFYKNYVDNNKLAWTGKGNLKTRNSRSTRNKFVNIHSIIHSETN